MFIKMLPSPFKTHLRNTASCWKVQPENIPKLLFWDLLISLFVNAHVLDFCVCVLYSKDRYETTPPKQITIKTTTNLYDTSTHHNNMTGYYYEDVTTIIMFESICACPGCPAALGTACLQTSEYTLQHVCFSICAVLFSPSLTTVQKGSLEIDLFFLLFLQSACLQEIKPSRTPQKNKKKTKINTYLVFWSQRIIQRLEAAVDASHLTDRREPACQCPLHHHGPPGVQ